MASTGPKISSCAIRLLCATLVNKVGLQKNPLPGIGQELWYTSAPSFFPMLIYLLIVSNCVFELIAPMSVFLSRGSPTIRVSIRSFNFLNTTSYIDSCTNNLEPAQQT